MKQRLALVAALLALSLVACATEAEVAEQRARLVEGRAERIASEAAELKSAEETWSLLGRTVATNRAGNEAAVITRADLAGGEIWIEPDFWNAMLYQVKRGVARDLAIIRDDRTRAGREIRIRDAYTGQTLARWSGSSYSE